MGKSSDVTMNYSTSKMGARYANGRSSGLAREMVAITNGTTIYIGDSTNFAAWLNPTTTVADWTLSVGAIVIKSWSATSQIDYPIVSPGTYTLTATGTFGTITITIVVTATSTGSVYEPRAVRSFIDIPNNRFGYVFRAPMKSIANWAGTSSTYFLVTEEAANGYAPIYSNIITYGTDSVEFTLYYPYGYAGTTTEKFCYGADSSTAKIWATDLTGPYKHPSDTIYWFKPVNGSFLLPTDTYQPIGLTLGDNLTKPLPVWRFGIVAGATTIMNMNFFHLGTGATVAARYKVGSTGAYTSLPAPTRIGNSNNYATSLDITAISGDLYVQWGEVIGGIFTPSACMSISGATPGSYNVANNAIKTTL